MTTPPGALHVYQRDLDASHPTSLSLLAQWVAPGSRVLDLGCGSGALGHHLATQHACTVDGVTHNAQEAALAAPAYRRVEVADLETLDLAQAFGEGGYDTVVCADVLEHLRDPARVLHAARTLLAPHGQLLISVPNVAYAGLLAELLDGEFAYRPEGLLDRTHLRFYTRRSLRRFIESAGWQVHDWQGLPRALPDSEFTAAFDRLPPAVARHLLAGPDALTYQFLVRARPLQPGEPVRRDESTDITQAQAHFSAQLYWRTDDAGYRENNKRVVLGVMGQARQTLRFDLPARTPALTALRFDPADRPGFLHLHHWSLRAPDGQVVWEQALTPDTLRDARHRQLAIAHGWWAEGALLLLHGQDPALEVPAPAAAVQAAAGGCFEVTLGWPMSADHLQLAGLADALATREHEARRALQESHATLLALTRESQALRAQLAERSREVRELTAGAGPLRQQLEALHRDHDELTRRSLALEAHFVRYHQSLLYRATRPLSRVKWAVRRLLGAASAAAPAAADESRAESAAPAPQVPPAVPAGTVQAAAPPAPQAAPGITPPDLPVDIVIPVYKGIEDTRRCIESVLAARNDTPHRIVVIDDTSPDAEVVAYLRSLEGRDPRLLLLHHAHNQGFVRSVNHGMDHAGAHDVILLNSDTEVAGNWLDRLRRAAYSAERVGTATPYTNNATICSYPRFCENNPLPAGHDTAALDALFARENAGRTLELPTGVGFCLYLRRDCLADTGPFDAELFGQGYGEEGEFCMRARRKGWTHLLAQDVFVRHAGGISFGETKSQREHEAQIVLDTLYPEYPRLVHAHLMQDPARAGRLAVDAVRLQAQPRPAVLMVLHAMGGGTERHVRELQAAIDARMNVFTLRPAPQGELLLAQLHPREGFALVFRPWQEGEFDALVQALQALGVCHVHFHHLLGHDRALVTRLPARLGVGYDYTAHDFHALCPQITLTDERRRYCGERGLAQCQACVGRRPTPDGVDIETWRSDFRLLLDGARHVFAPSRDAARRLTRLTPTRPVIVLPHADIPDASTLPAPAPRPLPADRPLRIAVIGALSEVKGADLLEQAAERAARARLPLDFHLLGHAWRTLRTHPQAQLSVHGAYQEADLPALLAWLQPDLVWFPAQWPETYSYTLSAALQAGLPIAAPALGAFPERLSGRRWTWLRPWAASAADWNTFFETIRREHFLPGLGPTPPLVALPPMPEGALVEQGFDFSTDYLLGLTARADTPPARIDADFVRRYAA